MTRAMNCEEFHHWLTSRDIHGCVLPEEVVAHMADCRDCELMYNKDADLEQKIARAFSLEEVPRDLPGRIDAALDPDAGQAYAAKL